MSALAEFLKGSTVRISLESKLVSSGALVDPTTLTLTVKNPDDSETAYTYGVGTAIVKDAVGKYHFDLLLYLPGLFMWKWLAGGTDTGVAEGSLKCKNSIIG